MSEYRRYVRKMWIGVEYQLVDPSYPSQHKPYYQRELVGVIRRSGWIQQVGHFCHTYVSYFGKKRYAANAEARIFPFHSLQLDIGELPRKLELVWLGWCTDNSTPAFISERLFPLKLVDAGAAPYNTRTVDPAKWQKEWVDERYLREMWKTQGMLRVKQVADEMARKLEIRKMRDEASAKRWAQEKEEA